MSSWKTCCPAYSRKLNGALTPVTLSCRANPVETNLIRGGSTDQERMDKPLDVACGCKREAPAAYATGGKYTDSSFLTMKYAMKAASYQSRGKQQYQCCITPSTTPSGVSADSSVNNYTADRIMMAKAGCNVCGNN